MFIADTLRRANLRETLPLEELKPLELVHHTENLRVSPKIQPSRLGDPRDKEDLPSV